MTFLPLGLVALYLINVYPVHAFINVAPTRQASLRCAPPSTSASSRGLGGDRPTAMMASPSLSSEDSTKDDEMQASSMKEIPGPRKWPVLGNAVGLMRTGGMFNYLLQLNQRYGDVYKCNLMGLDCFVVSDPEIVQEAFSPKHSDNLQDNGPIPVITNLGLDKGIVFSTGSRWSINRQLSNPAFQRADMLQRWAPIVAEESNKLVDFYGRFSPGTVRDMTLDMRNVTLEIVNRGAFSLATGLVGGSNTDSSSKARQNIFADMIKYLGRTFLIPAEWALPFSRSYRRARRLNKVIAQLQSDIINDRRIERAQSAKGEDRPNRDLLDVYLDAQENDQDMPDDCIRNSLLDIMLAGTDTTSSTISSTVYTILQHPNVHAKVLQELESSGWDPKDPSSYTSSGLAKLPYLEQCVKEVLRLYPPAAEVGKVAVDDMVLSGYQVAANTYLLVDIYGIHIHRKIWGDDVMSFRPERFDSLAIKSRHPYAWLPFGVGPHRCLGARLAMMEAVGCVANLFASLDLQPLELEKPVPVEFYFVMEFPQGVPIKIMGRKGN